MATYVAQPPTALSIAELSDALTSMQQCSGFDALLAATASLLQAAGSPAHLALFMPADGTNWWSMQRLLPAGSNTGAFDTSSAAPVQIPDTSTEGLAGAGSVVHHALELNGYAEPARFTAPRAPIAANIAGARTLLLALPTAASDRAFVTSALRHAALAAESTFAAPLRPSSLLSSTQFEARAGDEIARAKRYGRALALLVFRPEGDASAATLGRALSTRVRQWDVIGLFPPAQNEVAVLLPETDRGGGLGFINRWRAELKGVQLGAAAFPADGRSLAELTALANMRSIRISAPQGAGRASASGTAWYRGAPSGLGPETVLCPACLQAYSRAWRRMPDRAVAERDRRSAQAWLAATCPDHGEQIAVTARTPDEPSGSPARNTPAMALIARLRRPNVAAGSRVVRDSGPLIA